MPPPTDPAASLDQLASVFRFTGEQLAANQVGRVALGQLTTTILSAGLAALFVGLILIGGQHWSRSARGFKRVAALVACLAGGAALVGMVGLPAVRDLASGSVASWEGKVDAVTSVGKGRGNAVLIVGKLRLLTEADPFAARRLFESEGRYRIYYLRYSGRLLSLERSTMPPAPARDR